jgi:hypothetical protein
VDKPPAASTGVTAAVIAREYGLSHADLTRILPRFWRGVVPLGDASHGWLFELDDGRSFTVLPGPELLRRVGLIRLPYVRLRVAFRGFSAEEIAGFWRHFDRSFQKGGG